MPFFKIRITSNNEEEGMLLRQALRYAFGDALTLAKPRKGNNPKYADDPKFLAYGELDLSDAELAAAAQVASGAAPTSPPAPAPKPKRARKTPAPATGATISLTPPAKRRRSKP